MLFITFQMKCFQLNNRKEENFKRIEQGVAFMEQNTFKLTI